VFTPRREHARICSAACRVAWNREHTGDPGAEASALEWSITAMRDAVKRLATEQAPHDAYGFEMISDVVWRVTLVDATLVRYHHRAYEAALRAQGPDGRQAVAATLAGLRFVRNRMGYHSDPAEFIQPKHNHPGSDRRVAAWRWRSLPEPALALLPPRGQAWEMRRYQAYQAQLAGRTIGETFSRAAGFLKQASAKPTAALPADRYSSTSDSSTVCFSGRTYPQVAIQHASVGRCCRSPLPAVGRGRCCHGCCQLSPGCPRAS
jgi:hypothetical protein